MNGVVEMAFGVSQDIELMQRNQASDLMRAVCVLLMRLRVLFVDLRVICRPVGS